MADVKERTPAVSGGQYRLLGLPKGETRMADKGPEATVFSWPHLLLLEVLTALSVTLLLLFISVIVDAPLREIANPDQAENPAKAPWYFLNLQELLLHMNPSLAGVIIPSLVLLALMVLPYLDRDKRDVGRWFATHRGKQIVLFSAIYTLIPQVGLILFDEYVKWKKLFKGWPKAFVPFSEPISGWVIPLGIIGILMLFLYLGLRRYRPTRREVALAYFTGFVISYFLLTIAGLFFRGVGMRLILPWNLPPGGLSF